MKWVNLSCQNMMHWYWKCEMYDCSEMLNYNCKKWKISRMMNVLDLPAHFTTEQHITTEQQLYLWSKRRPLKNENLGPAKSQKPEIPTLTLKLGITGVKMFFSCEFCNPLDLSRFTHSLNKVIPNRSTKTKIISNKYCLWSDLIFVIFSPHRFSRHRFFST